MLRRLDEPAIESVPVSAPQTAIPSGVEPFLVEERPVGIRFYKGRSSFFRPYALLQAMSFSDDALTLVFANLEVVIKGRGLHEPYVLGASQRLSAIVEQGERYSSTSNAQVHISRIERTPRTRTKRPESAPTQNSDTEDGLADSADDGQISRP
jgi:hypothetical protein